MRPITKREYVLAGLFSFIALLPLATTVDGQDIDILPPLATVLGRREVLQLRNDAIRQDRLGAKLREVCISRSQTDPDVVCPDVNDTAAVRKFLKGGDVSATHAAATGSTTGVLQLLDLTETQRGMIRRYIKVRACPDTLNLIIPGFYELCTTMLRKTMDTRPQPTGFRGVFTEEYVKPTLEKLIKMRNPEE